MKYLVLAVSALFALNAFANGNPSSVKIKIYGVAIGTNADCSNAKVLNYNPNGVTYDMLTNPVLFGGAINPGTYNCVIMYMDSAISFVPATTVGSNCVAGTTYQRTVCHSDGGGQYTVAQPDSNGYLQYTGAQTCTSANSSDIAHSNKVLLFLSTQSTGVGTGSFQQPVTAGTTNGIHLGGALNVSSNGGTGTFVVNFNGQIQDTGSMCDLQAPTFSFR